MYVGVPKNYGGTAFQHEKRENNAHEQRMSIPQTLPHPPIAEPEKKESKKPCEECKNDSRNPLSCLFDALRNGKKGGIDGEDFLILGLIALLIGKSGNEDIVFILVMLLLL